MRIMRNARDRALLSGVRWLIGNVDRRSDEEVVGLIRKINKALASVSPGSPKVMKIRGQLDQLAEYMDRPDNNATQIMRRILALDETAREKLIMNVGVYGSVLGARIRERIERERGFVPPMFLVISPHMGCNLHCDNCYAWKFDRRDVLTFSVMDSVCDQMEETGCGFITISGGEPYLYEDPETKQTIWDLFEAHPHTYFQTYTNGTQLADDKVIERMLSLGNVAPAISVEGLESQTVARRGHKTWLAILEAMRLMKEAKLPFGFSVTATRHNADLIASDGFIDFWIDKGCLFGWTFQVIPIGAGDVNDMVTAEQRDRLRQFTVEDVRKRKPVLWFDFWNDGKLVDGCIAGGRHCHVLNDGRVTACVFSPFTPPGYNVREQPLLDILEKAPYFRAFREHQAKRKHDPLRPCAIIDWPEHLTLSVREGGAEPAYRGAEQLVKPEMTQLLIEKAEPYRNLIERA